MLTAYPKMRETDIRIQRAVGVLGEPAAFQKILWDRGWKKCRVLVVSPSDSVRKIVSRMESAQITNAKFVTAECLYADEGTRLIWMGFRLAAGEQELPAETVPLSEDHTILDIVEAHDNAQTPILIDTEFGLCEVETLFKQSACLDLRYLGHRFR